MVNGEFTKYCKSIFCKFIIVLFFKIIYIEIIEMNNLDINNLMHFCFMDFEEILKFWCLCKFSGKSLLSYLFCNSERYDRTQNTEVVIICDRSVAQ